MLNDIQTALINIKEKKPLILNLTNHVTMDFMANCLLAIGAAPLMSEEPAEITELINISDCLNINIGTLDKKFQKFAQYAANYAKQRKKPIILDPVGCGASLLRTATARSLLTSADIMRGNASEIKAIIDNSNKTLGVEATHEVTAATQAALALAKTHNNVIAISGTKDFITDGNKSEIVSYGSMLMQKVTGMGCALNAVIAAFRAVITNSFYATKLAIVYFNICGEITYQQAKGPGSFRTIFIDMLYNTNSTALTSFIIGTQ